MKAASLEKETVQTAPFHRQVEHYWNCEALQHPACIRQIFVFTNTFILLQFGLISNVIETMPGKNHSG